MQNNHLLSNKNTVKKRITEQCIRLCVVTGIFFLLLSGILIWKKPMLQVYRGSFVQGTFIDSHQVDHNGLFEGGSYFGHICFGSAETKSQQIMVVIESCDVNLARARPKIRIPGLVKSGYNPAHISTSFNLKWLLLGNSGLDFMNALLLPVLAIIVVYVFLVVLLIGNIRTELKIYRLFKLENQQY